MLFCYKILLHWHIVIYPQIFSTYSSTRFITERSPHSQISHYFCHKHAAHERIQLSTFFCQHCCNPGSFFALNSIIYFRYHRQSHLRTFLRSRKPTQNIVEKNEKTHSNMILEQLVRSVTKNIAVSTKHCFLLFSSTYQHLVGCMKL